MQTNRMPLGGVFGRYCRVFTVIAVSAMLLTIGIDGTSNSSDGMESYEVAKKKSTRHKRIKRLKLADPESSETMLA